MVKLKYGIRQFDNKVVSIEDVSSGSECNCVCPECGTKLIARKGNHNDHHFAHESYSNCKIEYINQTLLHKLAKQIIYEEKAITLPEMKVYRKELELEKLSPFVSNELPEEFVYKHSEKVEFDVVELEKKYEDFIPDISCAINEKKYFIEIMVCHPVDEQKKEKVAKTHIPMLEIDLSSFKDNPIEKERLIDEILNQQNNKMWIYHPEFDSAINKATKISEKIIEKATYKEKREKERREQENRARENKEREKKEKKKNAKKIMSSLLSPANYKQSLCNLRSDQQFRERYNKTPNDYRFYNNDRIPFFIDIPISGEMVFQCDRRIWQGIIFNRWIYNRKDDNAVAFVSKFFNELVNTHNIPINQDLCDDYMYFDNGVGESVPLKRSVINQYVFWLEYLGFIKNDSGKITVLKRKTVEPPNSLKVSWLKEALSNVDEYSPNVDQNLYFSVRELETQYESEKQNEMAKKRREEERIRREREDKENYEKGKLEIQNLDFSQDNQIIDSFGNRWFLCDECGRKCREKEMASYIRNKGQCQKCIQKR